MFAEPTNQCANRCTMGDVETWIYRAHLLGTRWTLSNARRFASLVTERRPDELEQSSGDDGGGDELPQTIDELRRVVNERRDRGEHVLAFAYCRRGSEWYKLVYRLGDASLAPRAETSRTVLVTHAIVRWSEEGDLSTRCSEQLLDEIAVDEVRDHCLEAERRRSARAAAATRQAALERHRRRFTCYRALLIVALCIVVARLATTYRRGSARWDARIGSFLGGAFGGLGAYMLWRSLARDDVARLRAIALGDRASL